MPFALLGCAALVDVAPGADVCTFQPNLDYADGKNGQPHPKANDAPACCALCTAAPNGTCLVAIWTPSGGGSCWFKKGPNLKPRPATGVSACWPAGHPAPPPPPPSPPHPTPPHPTPPHPTPPHPPPAPKPPAPPPGVGAFKLEAWGADGVRVRVAPAGQSGVAEPYVPALLPEPPAAALGAVVACTPDGTTLVNGNIKVVLAAATGLVNVTRVSDGAVLLEQTALVWGTPGPRQGSRPGAVSVGVHFKGLAPNESVYGLGEHKNGRVDQGRAGYTKIFANSLFYRNSQGGDVSIPWYMSSKGYGFVWNLPSLGSLGISANSATHPAIGWQSSSSLGADFYVTTTPDTLAPGAAPYPSLLRNYADVTGHATVMPPWATGFIQSKDRYRNQTQLMDVARGYKQRKLPISMIVIDWFYWKNMGDWALNEACWPDPQGMVDELRAMGIELMVTVWPFVGMPYPNGTATSVNWGEFSSAGYLVKNATSSAQDSFWRAATPTGNALVDSTNPAAMNSTVEHWYKGIGRFGVKAIWMDESEPDHLKYISGGQWRLHAGTDAEVLPAWTKLWAAGFANKLREISDGDGDFFILSRSAWVGTASSGAALWSGDTGSSFRELATAVKAGQQAGLSGIPLWTTDIGGYVGGDPSKPIFQELIVRWFQFGALCPLFRLHGHRGGKSNPPPNQCGPTNGDNEVWNLAKDPEHYDAIVAVMKLRETLRGYVQQINNVSAETGMPMMRPMFLAYPEDAVCANNSAEAQFMLGPDWLVSPVTAAGATSWPVYLPAPGPGAEWVYWWNQTTVPSPDIGVWHNISVAAIADFPLFHRRNASLRLA